MASSLPGSLSPLHSMIRHLVHGHGAAQNAVGCAYAMRSLSTGGIVRNGSSPDPEGPQDREYEPPTIKVTSITRKRGMDILHDPWYNKVSNLSSGSCVSSRVQIALHCGWARNDVTTTLIVHAASPSFVCATALASSCSNSLCFQQHLHRLPPAGAGCTAATHPCAKAHATHVQL